MSLAFLRASPDYFKRSSVRQWWQLWDVGTITPPLTPGCCWHCGTTSDDVMMPNYGICSCVSPDYFIKKFQLHHLRWHYDTKLWHPESSDDVIGIVAPPPMMWRCQTMASRVIGISGLFNFKISIVWQWWQLPGWCWHHHTTSNSSLESLDDVIGIISPPLATWQYQTNSIQRHWYLWIILFKNLNCSAPCPKMTLCLTEVDCWFFWSSSRTHASMHKNK